MSAKFVKKLVVLCFALAFVPASYAWAASVIHDPVLAKAIRAELHLSSDIELQAGDLAKLESLYPKNGTDKIADLRGLEYAVNMDSLFLPGQQLNDISALGKLNKLTFLALDGNRITDLSPLSGLTSLEKLVVDGNQIKSLEPLRNLRSLTDLLAGNNQVADLSPIRNLRLEWLIMDGNRIQDLTPLQNHPTLAYLYLDNNLIRNIEALETIPNLLEVSLANNPLNEQAGEVVKKLQSKGVTVNLGKQQETQTAGIQVLLDAEPVAFDVPPFVKNRSTMVPFRALFEKLGLQVTWIKDTQTIIGKKEGMEIKMKVGQPSADVNGKAISLAVAPTIVSGSTFVPLRFVAESLDAKVAWDDSSKMAVIRSKQRFASSDGSVEVTAYGKWTPFEDASEFTKLAIETFSWSTLVIREVPKQDLAPGTDLDRFYQEAKTRLLADSETDMMEETEQKFQGHPAKRLVYDKLEDDWKPFVCTAIFFEAGGRFYQIVASANADILEDAQQELDEMLGTLKLGKQQGN